VLITLLVLWVVVIPALTVAGTYVLSPILSRRLTLRGKDPGGGNYSPRRLNT
jgi:hypothetical protein